MKDSYAASQHSQFCVSKQALMIDQLYIGNSLIFVACKSCDVKYVLNLHFLALDIFYFHLEKIF